jgi:hypothetical protein
LDFPAGKGDLLFNTGATVHPANGAKVKNEQEGKAS